MFVKLEKGVPTEWPVNQDRIRFDNKNVSFPSNMESVDVRPYGFAPFKYSDPEPYDPKWQKAEELPPVEVANTFMQQWQIVDLYTEAEKANKILDIEAEELLAAQNFVRLKRNSLLSESDWTQVDDAPVDKAAWATYRQALRDITDQVGFPHTVEWPVKP